MNKPPFTTPYISFEIKDDVLYVTYLAGAVITLEVAKEVVRQRLEYTNNITYPLLVTGEGLRAMEKTARDYLSTPIGTMHVSAGALLVNSVYTEFFGNFYLKISKPKVPAMVFTDRQAALNWLEQFKTKS